MMLPGKGAVEKHTALSEKAQLDKTVPGVAPSNRAARYVAKKKSHKPAVAVAAAEERDPEADLTPEERAAISRGDAPPIAESSRVRRRGNRKGAALATGGNGSTLG